MPPRSSSRSRRLDRRDFEPEYTPDHLRRDGRAGRGGQGARRARASSTAATRRSATGNAKHARRDPQGRRGRPGPRCTSSTSSAPAAPSTWPQSLATLEAARDRGPRRHRLHVPVQLLGDHRGSPRFGDGWQERFRITYGDLQIAGTGERLTEATFNQSQRARTSSPPRTPSPKPTSSPCLQTAG